MSGERPWWFPTAVFVAPLAIAIFVTATLIEIHADAPDWLLAGLFVASIAWPVIDLARREVHARNEGILPRLRSDWSRGLVPFGWWPVTFSVTVIALDAVLLARLAFGPGGLAWQAYFGLLTIVAWTMWRSAKHLRAYTRE
jgi:hypothetical protein